MPPNTFVIIFDDSSEYVETVGEILVEEGHTRGSAGSIQALRENLHEWALNTRDRPFIVALIDNQAPWKDGEEPDPKGVGRIAELIIKAAFPDAITVATTIRGNDDVGYGDFRHNKREGIVGLAKFITQLPAKER